jgi:hypothetical protein
MNRSNPTLVIIISTLVFLFFGRSAYSQSGPVCEVSSGYNCWYVSPSGSDSNDGSFDYPFGTINHGLQMANPGDIVYVREGDYRIADGEGMISFPRSGNPENPITLKGYPNEAATIIGSTRLNSWALYSGNIYRHPAPSIDIQGLFEDGIRVNHPLYIEGATRVHPPLSYVDAPGKWTLQSGYVYLWIFGGDNPNNHAIEASQVRGIAASGNNLRIENLNVFYTQRPGSDAGGGIHIKGDNIVVNNVTVGKNSCGNGNAYAVYFYSSSNSKISNSVIFDSHYWGGDGADQNSHVISLVDSGDNGPIIIEKNEIYNSGGQGIGSKGANVNIIIRDNYIHGTAAGVRVSGERSSGPGGGKTDRGHYRIYRNVFESNTNGVRIPDPYSQDNRIYNNVFANNKRGVSFRDHEQSIYDTQIINNIFLNNDYAIHLLEKLYGDNSHYNEETFQYFKERGLVSHHNLFWGNGADWGNQINDWGTPTVITKTYEEIFSYKSLGWEENSLGQDPSLDVDYYPLAGSPVIDVGFNMGLPYNGVAPDIGAYEYEASSCPNTQCDAGETCFSCPQDCACSSPEICCNDQCITPACFQDPGCGSDPCKDYTCSNPGTCSASCSSQDKACGPPDGCCPPGCTHTNDNDCPQGIVTETWGDVPDSNHPGTIDDTYININYDVNFNDEFLNTYTWQDNQPANAILIKWNLSSLSENIKVQDAKLMLYLNLSRGDDPYEVSAHRIVNYNPDLTRADGYTYDGTNSWTPNNCCYNNIPLAQADITSAEDIHATNSTPGYKEWNVTQMVSFWISNPSENFGMLLNSDSTASANSYRYFVSSDHLNTNWRPKLVITYSIQTYHRADTNQDNCIKTNELLAFIKRWKVSSQDVPMPELMEAIGLWNSGVGYS